MYLLEDVPLLVKHTLVFYALCDLYALVPQHLQQEVLCARRDRRFNV